MNVKRFLQLRLQNMQRMCGDYSSFNCDLDSLKVELEVKKENLIVTSHILTFDTLDELSYFFNANYQKFLKDIISIDMNLLVPTPYFKLECRISGVDTTFIKEVVGVLKSNLDKMPNI